MQYKVPQNIDIEDKVIAGLTLRQFMFIMIAGGFGLLEYFALQGPLQFLFLPLAIITGGIGVAFAFVKVNDRPFEVFVIAVIKSLFSTHERVWRKDDDLDIPAHKETPKVVKKATGKKRDIKEIKSGLEKLAMLVDSGGVAGLDEDRPTADRQTNISSESKQDPENLHDVLAKTEEESPVVDAIIKQAREYVDSNKKKEQPISAVATKEVKKEDFSYEKIELEDEKKLEETLKKVQSKQKELEEKFENAHIEKFERDKI